MTWAGFLIAATIAALGGAASLLMSGKNPEFAWIAVALSAGTFKATLTAVDAVRPRKFALPGNLPENWLPENWMSYPDGPFDLQQARVEQATCLNNGIRDNARDAETSGEALRNSINTAVLSVAFSGVATILMLLVEQLA
jgi:hypothetical protein